MSKSFLILLVLVIFLGAGFGGSFVGGIIYGQSLEDDTENELSPRLGSAGLLPGGGQGAGQRGQGRRGQGGGPASTQADVGDTSAVENAGLGDSPQGDRLELPEGTGAPAPGESQARRVPAGEGRNQSDENETSPSETTGETEDVAGGPSESEPTGRPASPGSSTETGGRPSGSRGGLSGTILGFEGDTLTVESPRGEVAVTLAETTTVYELIIASSETLAEGATIRINGSRDSGGSLVAQAVIVLPEGAEGLFSTGGPGGRQRGGGP